MKYTSINGTKCKSGLLNRYNSIDISSLANGMYFVTIHNSNSILQKSNSSLIIEK